MYVIIRTDQGGGYVADIRKSKGASYTGKLQNAKIFATREQAERDRCPENEKIVSVDDVLFKR